MRLLSLVKLLPQMRWCFLKRLYSQQHAAEPIRNFGILAHIDAGKTTTTERMLFYSGTISHMGEVHHGNTVTDFMDQERDRGITITSAAVTFNWNGHKLNLIDTPGHIDFTMEVEQTLQVLDGCVVVLDASAGVEAQTCTVWTQADRQQLPRLVFVNKMDRADADFEASVWSLRSRLDACPVAVQEPLKEVGAKGFTALLDLVNLRLLRWDGRPGPNVASSPLDGHLLEMAAERRLLLIEQLADMDEALADQVIRTESLAAVTPDELRAALRRATIAQKCVPVLCGSAYHNAGVQPLMDAVCSYLPAPSERPPSPFGDAFCARAFKVRHDAHKGAVTFFRVFSGQLRKGQKLFNVRLGRTEQSGQVLIPYADEFKEQKQIDCGNIAAVTGLKDTFAGDFVTESAAAAAKAKTALMNSQNISAEEAERLLGSSGASNEPVFFCSIEPPSQGAQKALESALAELQREDPGLRVTFDPETGQTVLGGMGELHLEVIRERIRAEHKIDADLGPLQIAYKESLRHAVRDEHQFQQKIGSSKSSVNLTLSLEPQDSMAAPLTLEVDKQGEDASKMNHLPPRILAAVRRGVAAGLASGPLLGCPVLGVRPILHALATTPGTSDTAIVAAAVQCVHKLLKTGETRLLEPVMLVELVADPEVLSAIISDLGQRRSTIVSITERSKQKVVVAQTPLAELLGYSRELRTRTSGRSSFSMEFHSLRPMSQLETNAAIKSVTGFDPTF